MDRGQVLIDWPIVLSQFLLERERVLKVLQRRGIVTQEVEETAQSQACAQFPKPITDFAAQP
jgi:hypothetical protein